MKKTFILFACLILAGIWLIAGASLGPIAFTNLPVAVYLVVAAAWGLTGATTVCLVIAKATKNQPQ